MPRLPPVTSATLPRTLKSSSIFIVLLLVSTRVGQFPACFRRRTGQPAPSLYAAARRFSRSAGARRTPRAKCRVVLRDTAPLRVFLFLFDGAADLLEALLHSVLNDLQGIRAGPLNELSDVARVPDCCLERLFGEFG